MWFIDYKTILTKDNLKEKTNKDPVSVVAFVVMRSRFNIYSFTAHLPSYYGDRSI